MTSNKRLSACTAGAFFISFLSLLIFDRAYAATITINSLNDPGAPGICALRDAITAANTMTATNGCAAGTGTDTVNFSVSGTITLGSTLPQIANSLTIDGTGQSITISGNNIVQVMQVKTGATLKLQNLTIADGDSVDFAGGIQNVGTLTVTNSTFSNNNSVFDAGGIDNVGTLTVTNSTFSNNSANIDAGGLVGGIFNNGGTLTVTNSTFYANSGAAGGGILNGGTLTVTNSTFSNNFFAAIDNFSTANLKGTILAASNGSPNCAGNLSITDQGYNISDDNFCGFSKTGSAGNGDGVDPLLSTAGLANNGGPTLTIALQSESPAIDVIPVADCTDQASPPKRITTDQRGFPRPDFGEDVCDIGAYESQESFAGEPGAANCQGVSDSALSNQFGTINVAASALGFPSVKALQNAIRAFCGR
jgi:hypothetical protein